MIVALRYTVKANIGLEHVQHALAFAVLFRRNNSTWKNTSSVTFNECLQMRAKQNVQDKQHTQNMSQQKQCAWPGYGFFILDER
jgi:gamma-glutamylcysteine synthetase